MVQPESAANRRPVLLLFALTGASGLIYQVIWARQLGLVFGNTTTSISIVLSTFMAGLALGSWAAGKYLVQSGNPLRRYALFEGCIGLYAVLFGPLVKALESLYPALLSEDAGILTLTVCRTIGAFAVLIIPTTLMGATLPLTTEYLHRLKNEHKDWNAGKLYAANTFGAAAGSFASGFLLIEMVGIQATTLLAASFNLLVMLIGLRLSKEITGERSAEAAPGGQSPQSGPVHYRYLLLFALTGALALAGEVVWTRLLTLLLGNSTYAFSGMLVAYLVGIAAGSWLLSGRLDRFTDIRVLVPASLILTGVWYAAAVTAVDAAHSMAVSIRAEETGSWFQVCIYLLVTLLLLLPGALLSGSLFPVITRIIGGESGDRGRPIARAYTWNTAGCIAGSLAGGFLIAPGFFQYQAVYLMSLLALGSGLAALAMLDSESRHRFRVAGGIAVLAAAVWSGWNLGKEDIWLRQFRRIYPDSRILFHSSGLQGVTTAWTDRSDGSMFIGVNGRLMTVKAQVTKYMAHLPIMAHGGADDTLVICFGMGTTFRSALVYGGNVDVAELVPDVLRAFDLFYTDADLIRRNPRARLIVNDGRNFLLLTKRKYDVITIDPPPPIDAAGVNNLYSEEFIELMRDHLKPGGIAAHWIPSARPALGIYDALTVDKLIGTFRAVFPHVRVFTNSYGYHLIGSDRPFELTGAAIDAALANPAVAADLNELPREPFDRAEFSHEVVMPESVLQRIGRAGLVTDDRPWLEFTLLRNLAHGIWRYMFIATP